MASNNDNTNPQKTKWPELVGKPASEAKIIIEQESNQKLKVQIVPPDSMVTCDYRLDRVRIFEDKHHKVANAPTVG